MLQEFLKLELYPNPAVKKSFPAQVQEVKEKTFLILGPFDRGTLLFLYPAQEVLIEYVAEECRYQFSTRVVRRLQKPFFGYELLLPAPDEIQRIQLRRYVRVKKVLDVFYALVKKDEELNWKKGKSVDISIGGIKLATNEPLSVDACVKLRFYIELKGNVVEFVLDGLVKREEKKENHVYHYGIEFVNISRQEQDTLFAYLFQEMQKSRRMLADGK
ncbi:flagellar brake protein [Carboxydothermus hydrogenoformans]|uniref:Putative flagellar protein n=1 Tax=Carboxydothermus hydrogenoformans (strain ATCC BAA-161 / DSM 6008 / Z-2901) TaxID=246194 RepID=Q3ADC5_CARHZ|nr:PilZ domain-containing protein [Carboxydothermus hydrogenoformans]ABB15255.1 putative flagellar protein [Carboxydothermus hydrogenoformans Z-2901]